MKEQKELDFIVIGAAKSATTTLYELIKSHPQIFIPAAKEVPFFSDSKTYKKGVASYIKSYFSGANPEKLWGTVTPQYMLGQGDTNPEIVAGRIHKSLSDVKLIALLRDPAERAFSHYKMQLQRGYAKLSFEELVEQTLENPDKLRANTKPEDSFIFGSEYGRILGYYYSLFPRKNILLLTTEELRKSPEDVVREICTFIGIEKTYKPDSADKEHRKGGSKPRIKVLTPGFLFKIPLVEKVWKDYTPASARKRIEYFINLWNTKPDNAKLEKDSDTYRNLMGFYQPDLKKLEKISGKKLPWSG